MPLNNMSNTPESVQEYIENQTKDSGVGASIAHKLLNQIPKVTFKVKLTYFKESGKYYSFGSFETEHSLLEHWKVIDQVKTLIINKELPGLSKGHSDYTVLVESECGNFVPHLLTRETCMKYPPEN